MRRALAAMLALLSVPALAAIETTTITGTVYAPDGSVATGGSITCALTPTPGRASDGTNLQVVASRYVATISGSGTVSFTLVPNDVISPAGTVYACTYTITGPLRSTFTESWYVTTSPDPVSIGAIARVGGPTLTLPTITGASGTVQASNGSSGLLALPFVYSSGTTTSTASGTDLDGDGSAASADFNGDGTKDEAGVYQTNAARFDYLFGRDLSGAIDLDSNGTTYNPLNSTPERAAWRWQHASLYGDPYYYTMPSVIDSYWYIWRGHPLFADLDGDSTAGDNDVDGTNNVPAQLSIDQCSSGNCSNDRAEICLSAAGTSILGGYDYTGDGKPDLAVGDVVMFTIPLPGTPSLQQRTHVITAIGTGADAGGTTNCKNTITNGMLTVTPGIDQNVEGPDFDANGTVDSGTRLQNVWKNNIHISNDSMYTLGARILYAPRSLFGAHGPNLLRNGEIDYVSTTLLDNWTGSVATPFGSQGFKLSPGNSYQCTEGTSGSNNCIFFNTSTSGAYLESADWIDVTPGQKLCASGTGMFRNSYTVGFSEDRTLDGTMETPVAGLTYTFSSAVFSNFVDNSYPQWWWACFDVPELTHRVKLRFTRADATASYPLIDSVRVYQPTTYAADSITANQNGASSFVINDPGDGLIIITGDSYTNASPGQGQYTQQGAAAAATARFGRSMTSQVIASGKSGITASGLLDSSSCTTTNSTGGSTNCWYDSIGQYAGKAAYVVVHVGINDAAASVSASSFAASIKEIANRITAMGAIPVFLTPEPVQGTTSPPVGSGTTFDKVHILRDAMLRTFRNMVP